MIYVMLYLLSIIFANLLVHWFGIVTIGWLMFPAGAVVVGLTFSFRDFVQREYGKWNCWIWMVIASIITYLFNQEIAVASVSAFLVSESVDWLMFTIMKGSFNKRIIVSNLIGIPLDSIIFVWLAFGLNFQAILGQTIIKILSSFILLIRPNILKIAFK